MAAATDGHTVSVDRAERLARVLDDRQPEPLETGNIGRVAEHVDGEDRRRPLTDRRGRRLHREVQSQRVDIGEHRPGALVDRHVGACDERERARDHLVAIANA